MTRHKKGNMRRDKPLSKPRQPQRRYVWRRDGVGFDLYKSVYVEVDGIRKRRRLYLGHIGKSEMAEMRKRHKGKSLDAVIAQWIEEHDR